MKEGSRDPECSRAGPDGIMGDIMFVVTLSLFLQELLLYIDTLCFIMCCRFELARPIVSRYLKNVFLFSH